MIYCYRCSKCGKAIEEQRPSGTRNSRRKHYIVEATDCDGVMERDYQSEHAGQRSGELPDWVSVNAGVCPSQIDAANRAYAHLDVKFDHKGNAHVPGKQRNRFLKERGLVAEA
jgi:hypothetical protein